MVFCRCNKCKWLVRRIDFHRVKEGWYWYCDMNMMKLHRVLLPRFCDEFEKDENLEV